MELIQDSRKSLKTPDSVCQKLKLKKLFTLFKKDFRRQEEWLPRNGIRGSILIFWAPNVEQGRFQKMLSPRYRGDPSD